MRLLICSLVLLQTLSAAGDPRIVRLAREAGSKGWIVYSAKTEKGDWDLFLMRPDGSHRRNITNTPGTNEIGARFSPDGKRILFRRIPLEIKFNHDWWGRAGRLVIAGAGGSNPVDYGEIPWASWGPDDASGKVGGHLDAFRAGDVHRMALDAPLDQFWMGGVTCCRATATPS